MKVSIAEMTAYKMKEAKQVSGLRHKLSKRNKLCRSLRKEIYRLRLDNSRLLNELSARIPSNVIDCTEPPNSI